MAANSFGKAWIIVGYRDDGTIDGYLTERRTISDLRSSAARWSMEEIAQGTADALNNSPGWCAQVWIVEEADDNG